MIFKNLFRRKKPDSLAASWLIIGLGNPGPEHEKTRHNAGFLALDFLRGCYQFDDFHEENKFQATLTSGVIARKKVFLVKPLTFMNASGTSVSRLLDFYKIPPAQIIVIHDDVDLALGTFKTTNSSSSAGHNGVQNIIDTLGTQDFKRIRIGIGRPEKTETECLPVHEYVLRPFTPGELEILQTLFPEIQNTVATLLKQ